MDGFRFDNWTRTIAGERTTRQGLLRLAAGAGLAALVTTGAGVESAEAKRCRRDNAPCIPQGTGDCCSGRCKSVGGGVGRCRPTKKAKGCTVKNNSCAAKNRPGGVTCPKEPGGKCFIQRNGQPFCATKGGCANCSSNADCNRKFNRKGGRCVKCAACDNNKKTFCAFA